MLPRRVGSSCVEPDTRVNDEVSPRTADPHRALPGSTRAPSESWQLPDRGQSARRLRCGVRTVGLAAVPARELRRSVQHRPRCGRGDHRPPAAVRDTEHHRPTWEMIDELTEWGVPPPAAVRGRWLQRHHRLPARADRARHPYVVAVKGRAVQIRMDACRSRGLWRARPVPLHLRQLAGSACPPCRRHFGEVPP